MKDNSKIIAIVLVVITIGVLIFSFFTKGSKNYESKINIVTNYSNFYTVNSCLYRSLTYATTKDYDSLLLVINDDYKENNNINIDNVNKIFDVEEEDLNFVSEKMYYQELNDNIVKYYVSGYIEKNAIMDDAYVSNKEKERKYFIVYLDTKNSLFSIEPYEGKVFMDGGNNE